MKSLTLSLSYNNTLVVHTLSSNSDTHTHTPALITCVCSQKARPLCRHLARRLTWKTAVPSHRYFIFSLLQTQYLFHGYDNCLSRRSALRCTMQGIQTLPNILRGSGGIHAAHLQTCQQVHCVTGRHVCGLKAHGRFISPDMNDTSKDMSIFALQGGLESGKIYYSSHLHCYISFICDSLSGTHFVIRCQNLELALSQQQESEFYP